MPAARAPAANGRYPDRMSSQRRTPQGGKPHRGGRPTTAKGGAGKVGGSKPGAGKGSRAAKPAKRMPDAVAPEDLTPRTFRLGIIPGATPGRWIDAWKQRMPHVEIELVPISAQEQVHALRELDAAIVRLPVERSGPSSSEAPVGPEPLTDEFHVIRLYDETPVVVTSADSHLMAADELTAADLDGEVLITPLDDVLGPLGPSTTPPNFAPLATTADAVATVASGVGILVVPMSLARAHHRKDADHRPLVDGPLSPVALAWRRDRTTPDVDTFVGIVRGRTANSSR